MIDSVDACLTLSEIFDIIFEPGNIFSRILHFDEVSFISLDAKVFHQVL